METKIRWGIVGPGKIARKFISDLQLVEDAEVTAVASRSLGKAQDFAAEYAIENVFGSYEELFASDTADVVYIATPHRFHKALTLQALESGKHVLCEKPLGVSKPEVQEMVDVAQRNKVFLMEALWSRFNPSIQKVKQLVDDGEIGDLTHINADFGFYALDRDEESRVLNPDLASGSLLDIGIYPIFLTYLFLGMPSEVLAVSNFHSNGTELQTSMIFQYPKAQAVLYSGFTSRTRTEAELSGSQGEIFLPSRWHEADAYTLLKDGVSETFEHPLKGIGFYYEILEVHQCLRAKKMESDLWSHQNSLDVAELLDTVREKCGIRFPFEG